MITSRLFETVLVDPVKAGADRLYIISGYATAAMAFHHLQTLFSSRYRVKIHLIVGMCPQDGLSLNNHRAFQQLAGTEFPDNFECSYIMNPPPVHSKVYAWCKSRSPVCGFVGSANYTQGAFKASQQEAMEESQPKACLDYFNSMAKNSIFCTHPETEDCVQIYNDNEYRRQKSRRRDDDTNRDKSGHAGLSSVKVSLLDRNNTLPQRSGLNWGQRPELKRDPNQAYIRLPSKIARTDFFPARRTHFTLLTDDNKVLICTRAQDNGKAIETPENNSRIGEYFRNRLGVPNGYPVTKQHLLRHGRTDVEFYKIDDETYYMDFTKKKL